MLFQQQHYSNRIYWLLNKQLTTAREHLVEVPITDKPLRLGDIGEFDTIVLCINAQGKTMNP